MLISYAQNFEDVMLWRALKHVEHGFYVDLGAQDPVVDSVSKLFHEKGWRGVHVEPTVHYAALLREQRPGDVVVQAAVGDSAGVLPLFEIPNTGISTLDREIAEMHRARGYVIHETTTPIVTLSSVLQAAKTDAIHWMKIDVEGFERQVLASWGVCEIRPWIVVIESTLPSTQIESHQPWEQLLLQRGYAFAYLDGLNRYYVASGHAELLPSFAAPPNVFDGFALNGTASAPFHEAIKVRFESQIDELKRASDAQSEAVRHTVASHRDEEKLAREQWGAQRSTLEKQLADATAALDQQLRLGAQNQALLVTQRQLSQHQAERNEERIGELKAQAENAAVTKRSLEAALAVAKQEKVKAQELGHSLQGELSRRSEELHRVHTAAAEAAQSSQSRIAHLATEALERSDRLTATAIALTYAEEALKVARHEALSLSVQSSALKAELATIRTSWIWRLFMAGRQATPPPSYAPPIGNVSLPNLDLHASPTVQSPPMNDFTTDLRLARNDIEHALTLFDVAFVKQAYLVVLGREVDPDGLVYRLRSVRAGEDRESLLLTLALSDECIARHVEIAGMSELLDRVVSARYRWPFSAFVRGWCRSALRGGSQGKRRLANRALRGSGEPILKALRALDNRLAINAAHTDAQIRQMESFVSRLASTSTARNSAAPAAGTGSTPIPPVHRPAAGLPAAHARLQAEMLAELQKALPGRKT